VPKQDNLIHKIIYPVNLKTRKVCSLNADTSSTFTTVVLSRTADEGKTGNGNQTLCRHTRSQLQIIVLSEKRFDVKEHSYDHIPTQSANYPVYWI